MWKYFDVSGEQIEPDRAILRSRDGRWQVRGLRVLYAPWVSFGVFRFGVTINLYLRRFECGRKWMSFEFAKREFRVLSWTEKNHAR